MHFGALGDIHGDFAAAARIMERHCEVPFWLCVGDVADDEGRYEAFPAPLYFIKGNNENFDVLESALEGVARLPRNLHYLRNGELLDFGVGHPFAGWHLRVAGLGGTFAPTMYDVAAADLPHPKKASRKATELADRRRHFVREEVEACKGLQGIDIFLSHEAPRPFRVNRGIDAGKTPINEVLASMKPRLHLFGHHHRFAETEVGGVRSVALDLAARSYLLIDGNTLEYQHLPS